jgi:hypothetical protein
MTNLASLKNGKYYNIQNGDQIGEYFINCLGELMSVVAKEI